MISMFVGTKPLARLSDGAGSECSSLAVLKNLAATGSYRS